MDAEKISEQSKGLVEKIEAKTVSLFEKDGKTIEQLESSEFFHYDKSGNITRLEYTIPEKYTSRTNNVYNSKNQLIEQTSYLNSDPLVTRTEFSYNSEGLLVERRFYDRDNVLKNTHRPIYTSK